MVQYFIQLVIMAFAIFVMWACCTIWKEKKLLRRLMPVVAAVAVAIDYFVEGKDNLLYLIVMLVLILIYKWKDVDPRD